MPTGPQMTGPTLRVLRALLDAYYVDRDAQHYGLELAKSSGLPSGTIYPILARLEKYGLVAASWEDIDESQEGRRRRRYYTLTAEGARTAYKEFSELAPRHVRLAPRRGEA